MTVEIFEHQLSCVQIKVAINLFYFLLAAFARAAVRLGVFHRKVIQCLLSFSSTLLVTFTYKRQVFIFISTISNPGIKQTT